MSTYWMSLSVGNHTRHNILSLFQLTSGRWVALWQNSWPAELSFQEMIVRTLNSSTFVNIMRPISEIDQITKVLKLCGTPTNETLSKITSEEVNKWSFSFMRTKYLFVVCFLMFADSQDKRFPCRQSFTSGRCHRWTRRISKQSFLGRTLKVRIDWKACICKLLRHHN